MPLSNYYGGDGQQVMSDMAARYGKKKGEQVFYATANKKGEKPGGANPKTKGLESLHKGKRS